jgi:phospholipid-translocating ATPase
MEFLCVTGVEDKLQEDVLKTVENLRQAGIRIWMLTGDKVETAKIIAISTGLKGKTQPIYEMTNMENMKDIKRAIEEYGNLTSYLLVIDGGTLQRICSDELVKNEFFSIAQDAKSVCVCRCSPT